MTKTLLDGPGRVLESVYPRFLVDLAQGDDARLPQAHQQQFRERLMQELLARVQLQTWTNGGMLNAPLSLRLTLVEKLASMLDPGHLALTQIAQHLALLQKMDHAWSLPGRCFIVLEELRWGAFGDACRLGSPQAVALLLGDLLEKATQHLAESINAAPTTRHYYHQWFASSTVSTGGDHADFLSWLGKWTTADKQPVCWSVTQRWRTVALGMPRLCSAQRLAGAMLEEIFSVNLA